MLDWADRFAPLWGLPWGTVPLAVLVALVVDAQWGEPAARWHPVVWMGRALEALGQRIAPAAPTGRNFKCFWLSALAWCALIAIICIATGVGSGWAGSILWNIASQRLSASLCGQLIVSETLFALFYSFLWDGTWPGGLQLLAASLFTLGILASIRAHR